MVEIKKKISASLIFLNHKKYLYLLQMSYTKFRKGIFDYKNVRDVNRSKRENPNVYIKDELLAIVKGIGIKVPGGVNAKRSDLVKGILNKREQTLNNFDIKRFSSERTLRGRNGNEYYNKPELIRIAKNLGVNKRTYTKHQLYDTISKVPVIEELIQRQTMNEYKRKQKILKEITRERFAEQKRLYVEELQSLNDYLYNKDVNADELKISSNVDSQMLLQILRDHIGSIQGSRNKVLIMSKYETDDENEPASEVRTMLYLTPEGLDELIMGKLSFLDIPGSDPETALMEDILGSRYIGFKFVDHTDREETEYAKDNSIARAAARKARNRNPLAASDRVNNTVLNLGMFGYRTYDEIFTNRKYGLQFTKSVIHTPIPLLNIKLEEWLRHKYAALSEEAYDEMKFEYRYDHYGFFKKVKTVPDPENPGKRKEYIYTYNTPGVCDESCLFASMRYLGINMFDERLIPYCTIANPATDLKKIANDLDICFRYYQPSNISVKMRCFCPCECDTSIIGSKCKCRCKHVKGENETGCKEYKEKHFSQIGKEGWVRRNRTKTGCVGKNHGDKTKPMYKITSYHGHFFPYIKVENLTRFALTNYEKLVKLTDINWFNAVSLKVPALGFVKGNIDPDSSRAKTITSYELIETLDKKGLLPKMSKDLSMKLKSPNFKPMVNKDYKIDEIDISKQSSLNELIKFKSKYGSSILVGFDIETTTDSDKHETYGCAYTLIDFTEAIPGPQPVCKSKTDLKDRNYVRGDNPVYEYSNKFYTSSRKDACARMLDEVNKLVNIRYSMKPNAYRDSDSDCNLPKSLGMRDLYKYNRVIFMGHNVKYDLQGIAPFMCSTKVLGTNNKAKKFELTHVAYQNQLDTKIDGFDVPYGKTIMRIGTLDSNSFFGCALEKVPGMFGINLAKALLPYPFYNTKNVFKKYGFNNIHLLPENRTCKLQDFLAAFVKDEDRNACAMYIAENVDKFIKGKIPKIWLKCKDCETKSDEVKECKNCIQEVIKILGDEDFYFMRYSLHYCSIDVKVMVECFLKFRTMVRTELDPRKMIEVYKKKGLEILPQLDVYREEGEEDEDEIRSRDAVQYVKDPLKKYHIDILDFISMPGVANHFSELCGCFIGTCDLTGTTADIISQTYIGGKTMCALSYNQNGTDILDNPHTRWRHEVPVDDILDDKTLTMDERWDKIRMQSITSSDCNSLYPAALSGFGGYFKGYIKGNPKKIPLNSSLDDLKSISGLSEYFVQVKVLSMKTRLSLPCVSELDELGTRNFTNAIVGKTIWLDSITLRQAEEHQGMEFELCQGFYFNEGYNEYCLHLYDFMYNKRLEYKNEKDPLTGEKKPNHLQQILKLTMNSGYGYLGMAPHDIDSLVVSSDDLYEAIYKNRHRFIKATLLNDKYGNYLLELQGSARGHKNKIHQASLATASSKCIMNEVTSVAELLGILIYYMDTDSIHLKRGDLVILEEAFRKKYGKEMMGSELGQFSSDFDDTKDGFAVEAIYNGKKNYWEEVWDGKKFAYDHCRMKGVPTAINKCFKQPGLLYRTVFEGSSIRYNLVTYEPEFEVGTKTFQDIDEKGELVFLKDGEPKMISYMVYEASHETTAIPKIRMKRNIDYTFYTVDSLTRVTKIPEDSIVGRGKRN